MMSTITVWESLTPPAATESGEVRQCRLVVIVHYLLSIVLVDVWIDVLVNRRETLSVMVCTQVWI